MKSFRRTLPILWGALLLAACGDDATATSATEGDTDGDSSSSSSSSSSPSTTMTTVDESSSTASTTTTADSSGTGESSSDGDSSSSSDGDSDDSSSSGGGESSSGSTGNAVVCGDGVVEGDEICDGADVGAQSCADEGFEAGLLLCAGDCNGYDSSLCLAIPDCVEEDLGSAIGAVVTTGDTTDEDEDFVLACAGLNTAPDHTMLWVAPSAGLWRLSTEGSAYDTALAAYAGCDADTEIACDDDGGELPQTSSIITLDLQAGDPILVVVSGFNASVGPWTLAIEPAETGGPCCVPHVGPSCDDMDCADSVCEADPGCCQGGWSDNCANIASAFCEICTTPDVCGNAILDGMGEVCDGLDFGGDSCVTEGFDGGELACADDCSAIDSSGCLDYDGPCCSADLSPGCDDAQCTADVCEAQPFCCDVAWDFGCVLAADVLCNDLCNAPGVCGNGIVDVMDEECDEADLAGATCQDFGFDGGLLGCNGDCTLNSDACADFGGDCCVADGNPGCDDDACNTLICDIDPFCCNNAWDGQCAMEATASCEICGGTPPVCGNDVIELGEVCDGDPLGVDCTDLGFIGGQVSCAGDCDGLDSSACVANGGGDCCAADVTPGCDDLGCTLSVCAAEPACCELAWDGDCVAAAEQVCLACGGDPFCEEEDIASDLGLAVAAGTTVGEDEDFALSCIADGGAVDRVLTWTAPAAGTYLITTVGSDYDTALGVFTTCDASGEIACDDDGGGMLLSSVQLDLAADQTILIAVSGFGVATGNWTLNITQL